MISITTIIFLAVTAIMSPLSVYAKEYRPTVQLIATSSMNAHRRMGPSPDQYGHKVRLDRKELLQYKVQLVRKVRQDHREH